MSNEHEVTFYGTDNAFKTNQITEASKCSFEYEYTELCEYTIYSTLPILPLNCECFLLPYQQFI